ncbi:hypothetical protein I7X12_05625 [Halosimplex litoreum]|uniref:Uncharacterized protein n=1 Tax=Halosimplex litoreum TaxID=1198301 RepID=A0A7T3G0H0_9EURY|nr:hypothetical protein [Halosimplex litoreum]QPV64105.1 hypothetical protein I7X12_05625 [Halosimplex litoreum]
MVHTDFSEFIDEDLVAHHARSIANSLSDDGDLDEFERKQRRMSHFKRRVAPAVANLLRQHDIADISDDDIDLYLIAYSLVGEYGYEQYNTKGEEKYRQISDEGVHKGKKTAEHLISNIYNDLGHARVQGIIAHVRRTGEPTEFGHALLRRFDAIRDEDAPLYEGEKIFRRLRGREFKRWHSLMADDDPEHGYSLDDWVPDDLDLSQAQKDATVDHVLLEIDQETFERIEEGGKEALENLGPDEPEPYISADMLAEVGRDRVHEIAREVASVDVEAIDISEVVLDDDLKERATQLVEGEWPDWDLPVLPRYVRQYRGYRKDDDQPRPPASGQPAEQDDDTNGTSPADGSDDERSTAGADATGTEATDGSETAAGTYRIIRVCPDYDAMLWVDVEANARLWVRMDTVESNQLRSFEQFVPGNLVFATLVGGGSSEATLEPPAPEDCWEIEVAKLKADTTLTFYANVAWVPNIVHGAFEHAPGADQWGIGTSLEADPEDDPHRVEVRVSPATADKDEVFYEFLRAERSLEGLFEELGTSEDPAQDIMVVRPVDEPYVAVLAFTEASERVDNFHRDFQEESVKQ